MLMPNHVFAVVLAGGSGTRFWPKSRHKTPKQLCVLGDKHETMIEITLRRLDGFIPPERRLVVTHHEQLKKTKEIVGDLAHTIIPEPEARNTAPALATAALEIEYLARKQGLNQAPVMISLHADHIIQNVPEFLKDLQKATTIAESEKICLLGVKPRYAETGYG